ncbi:MAG: hypothetical protein GX857_07715 [Bacteroidales bacterium]|nr:hypothetical protein [Bacteroidales bacterium]
MLKRFYYLSLIVLIALSACNKEDDQLSNLKGLPVSFNTSVFEEVQTRVVGVNWENGDKIGVFAIKNGSALHEESIVENYDNLSFSTKGNGEFYHDGQPIYYPEDGAAIDFISYYPYKSNITAYNYPIDIAEQVDFMYSNNLKNASKTNSANNLDFHRVLSKVALNIKPKGQGSLEGLTIEVNGLKTKAVYSLANGNLVVDDTSSGQLLLTPTGTDTKKSVSFLLLPTSEMKSIEVVFKLGDKATYKWKIPHALTAESLYSYQINLDGMSSEVEPATSYMELPYYTSGGDAPHTLKALHMVGSTNWLNGYSGPNNQRNYTILYDIENCIPLWVAYPMHSIYMRSGNRTNDWGYDPIIPREYQSDNRGWTNSTYNRGHMLASADRSATRDLNRTTFYATNMVPQDVKMNGGVWNNLEQDLRSWVENSRYDTLYVVTGSILAQQGQIEYTNDKSGKRVAVPKYLYKALLKQEKSTKEWHSIAFKMDNKSNADAYKNSIVSVAELEQETGFTFFPNLGDATEVKKQKSLTHWN